MVDNLIQMKNEFNGLCDKATAFIKKAEAQLQGIGIDVEDTNILCIDPYECKLRYLDGKFQVDLYNDTYARTQPLLQESREVRLLCVQRLPYFIAIIEAELAKKIKDLKTKGVISPELIKLLSKE